MDVQPIIDARTKYIAAQSDAEIAQASLTASRQQAERLHQLLSQGAASVKDYQAAQAAALTDLAKLHASSLSLLNIKGGITSQFGGAIAAWVLAEHSPDFQRLLSHEDALLRVTLPLGEASEPPEEIVVDTNDDQSIRSALVSRAAQSDPDIQGRAYVYRVRAPLATGMRITARIPTAGSASTGVSVPSDAIVWYGGLPWVYKKIAADQFIRQQLFQPLEVGKTYFVKSGIAPATPVVVSGAQLLLSAELTPPPNQVSTKDPDGD